MEGGELRLLGVGRDLIYTYREEILQMSGAKMLVIFDRIRPHTVIVLRCAPDGTDLYLPVSKGRSTQRGWTGYVNGGGV